MVILNLELDNFLVFNQFKLNFSYPKKLVNSTIPEEHLAGRPNFRYKKLVVLMGANATGKTALSRILRSILNFISRREYSLITGLIEDPMKDASCLIDFAFSDFMLYRVEVKFKGRKDRQAEYRSEDIDVVVRSEQILKNDSYERCLERLIVKEIPQAESYIQELEKIPYLTWKFEDPFDASGKQRALEPVAPGFYTRILNKTLHALDPRILGVDRIPDTDNTFIIKYDNHFVLIKDGIVMEPEKLSSGTAEGIGVADLITAMKLRAMDFFFCDEKFSHIHSVSEKAFLSLLIELIGPNQQLIITTHNSDILDMDLPLHSFAFLRRNVSDEKQISCVFASDYLKKNTVSLKNEVENDLFSASPDTDMIFGISDLLREVKV